MSTVHEIEQAIRSLEPQDLAALRTFGRNEVGQAFEPDVRLESLTYASFFPNALRQWFAAFDAEIWDRQLEEDVAAGRLAWLAEEALRDLNEGRCTDL